tara:strand:+ start:12393 stop:12968 length:576 start_codon:yes stop_codon:yes gene_type:complete
MKRLLLALLALILSINVIGGQTETRDTGLTFGVYQDASLAFFEDDHGNSPFTLDYRLEFEMEAFANDYGSTVIGLTFEYADLSEFKFIRYGFQGGYKFLYMPFFWDKTYELSFLAGAGKIIRGTDTTLGYLSLELTTEVAYFIWDWFSVNAKVTMMQRGDLSAKYNDPSGSFRPWDWKPNGYLGIKFHLPI